MQPSLDQLIGDLKAEASRRRAAPDFPVEEEAALAAEMDRQGPYGGAVDLAASAAALESLKSGLDAPLAEVAGLTASALRSLSVRLRLIERRQARPPAAPVGDPVGDPIGDPAEPPPLEHWIPAVTAAATGRVLVAGVGCERWVSALAGAGVDAYGLDPAGEEFSDQGPVRAGSVLDHLESVGALGTAVLVGPVATSQLGSLDRWAEELRRAAGSVLAVSEAPWSWRRRVGPRASDTSGWRPVSAETWMELLAGAGFEVTADYSPGGRDYCVNAATGT